MFSEMKITKSVNVELMYDTRSGRQLSKIIVRTQGLYAPQVFYFVISISKLAIPAIAWSNSSQVSNVSVIIF
jgi:hypothetical protein